MRRRATCVLAAGVVLLLLGTQARALINPNFTPVTVARQSTVIAVLKCGPADKNGVIKGTPVEIIKGKDKAKGKTFTFDLSATGQKSITEAAVKKIEDASKNGEPILFFYGEYQEEGAVEEPFTGGFIHASGKWLSLYGEEKGVIDLDKIDAHMEGTWAGGTDMLLRCVKYVLKDPMPDVPTASGVSWDLKTKIATLKGTIRDLMPVDLAGDGNLSLFAVCETGDRLLLYQQEKKPFKDVTDERGLKSKSREAVWADFDQNGRLDLASTDGTTLTLWLQGKNGAFEAKPVSVPPKTALVGLTVLDVGAKGRPGLLVSTAGAPVLLKPGKDGAFEASSLPKASMSKDRGKPATALVADFDGDNLADILQPFEKLSVFYGGKGAGAFDAPKALNVATVKSPARACTGDFDHDGLLDIYIVAEDFSKLYHNRGKLVFEDRLYISGEIAYISKPDVTDCQVCDVNNDGRQDIFLSYSNIAPQTFFNRGFRSTGHAHTIDLPEQGLLEEVMEGHQAGLIADFNLDGAQDMVVTAPKGDTYIFYRRIDLSAALAVKVVLPTTGPFAGPLTVVGWQENRCLGAWNLTAGGPCAFIGRIDAGPVEVRWQFPGGKPQKKEIILEEKAVRLVLTPGK